MTEFTGPAVPLADADIAAAAQQLGVEPAVIAAVAEVESAGSGFLPDTRPRILYEAHVFGRLTAHRWDASHPNISAPAWDRSLYGASGAHQYDRLHEAMKLPWDELPGRGLCDRRGIRRGDVRERGRAPEGVSSRSADLATLIMHLAVHDWRAFTKIYNGPGQVDHYAQKLAEAYRRHQAAASGVSRPISAVTPRETIKRVQEVLGVVSDGAFGPRSRAKLDEVLRAAGQPGI